MGVVCRAEIRCCIYESAFGPGGHYQRAATAVPRAICCRATCSIQQDAAADAARPSVSRGAAHNLCLIRIGCAKRIARAAQPTPALQGHKPGSTRALDHLPGERGAPCSPGGSTGLTSAALRALSFVAQWGRSSAPGLGSCLAATPCACCCDAAASRRWLGPSDTHAPEAPSHRSARANPRGFHTPCQ